MSIIKIALNKALQGNFNTFFRKKCILACSEVHYNLNASNQIKMTNRKFQDKLNLKKDTITLNLTLISFQEDDYSVLYSPTLDLYGYGENEGEALNSFNETIYLYLEYGMNENTILQDLKNLGWERQKYFKKRFNTAKYSPKKIMQEKGIQNYALHNIVDKPLQLQA
ncbi:MAG: hypothetical protein AB8E82_15070 [Aureispira sp.]